MFCSSFCAAHAAPHTNTATLYPAATYFAGRGVCVQANGKISFNECGVDPGLDHMSACKIFDEVKAKGGKIITFLSCVTHLARSPSLPCPTCERSQVVAVGQCYWWWLLERRLLW